MYWKKIITHDGTEIRITPQQVEALMAAQKRDDKYIMLGGNMIAISSIARTEDTMEQIDQKGLPGIVASDTHHHSPVMVKTPGYPDSAKAILIKKKYPQKYYDKWLAQSSFAHLLETDGSWVWVAKTHVPCKECGVTVPDAIECEPDEYKRAGWRDQVAVA